MGDRVARHTRREYPIVQAPMGWIAQPARSEVSNAWWSLCFWHQSKLLRRRGRRLHGAEIARMRETGRQAVRAFNMPLLFNPRAANVDMVAAREGVKLRGGTVGRLRRPKLLPTAERRGDSPLPRPWPTSRRLFKAVEAGVDG